MSLSCTTAPWQESYQNVIIKTGRCAQAAFQKLLDVLQDLSYSPLDVLAARWYDDFATFRAGVQDLEAMFANVVQAAFDAASSLPQVIELLRVR